MPAYKQQTRAQARTSIYQLMRRNKYASGLVLASPSPTVSAFALEEAKRFPTDTFVGAGIYAVSGTGAGQSSLVSNSDAGTGLITIAPSVGTPFDSTTRVEILPDELTPDAVNEMINLAIDSLEDTVDVYVRYHNPVIDSTLCQITIPDDLTKLTEVSYLDAGNIWRPYRYRHNPEIPSEEHYYDFTVSGRTIYLSQPIPSDIVTTNIIIGGYRPPAHPTSDSDVLEAPIPFIVYHAAANLEQSLTGNVDVDAEGHQTRGGQWLAQAQLHRPSRDYSGMKPNTIVLDPVSVSAQ